MEEEFVTDNIILKYLQDNQEIKNSREFAEAQKIDLIDIEKTLKSLFAIEYVVLVTNEIQGW